MNKKLKVLDISQGVAGPLCGNLLWQFGAEVFKVEQKSGDWVRHISHNIGEHNALSISYNIGKKGLCIDLKRKEGQAIIHQMIKHCDVFIQNFRPGVMKRLGLNYEKLKEINPNLIYVSISGYGETGPYALSAATDSVMQAETGIMHTNRLASALPKKIKLLIVDILSGNNAAMQVLASLAHQRINSTDSSSIGEHIEVNLFDASIAFQLSNILENIIAENDLEQKEIIAPNSFFKTKNGYINILALNNEQFIRLAQSINKPEWIEDHRFLTNTQRIENKEILHEFIQEFVEEKTIEECVSLFKAHDVLHAPIRNYEQILTHPQALHNHTFDFFKQSENISFPFVFTSKLKNRPKITKAPDIGEHSIEVLKEFEFENEKINELINHSVVYQKID